MCSDRTNPTVRSLQKKWQHRNQNTTLPKLQEESSLKLQYLMKLVSYGVTCRSIYSFECATSLSPNKFGT